MSAAFIGADRVGYGLPAKMDVNLILNHPLAEYDPLNLLDTGSTLPLEATGLVVAWSDAIAKTIVDGGLLAPRDPMHILRGMTASL